MDLQAGESAKQACLVLVATDRQHGARSGVSAVVSELTEVPSQFDASCGSMCHHDGAGEAERGDFEVLEVPYTVCTSDSWQHLSSAPATFSQHT